MNTQMPAFRWTMKQTWEHFPFAHWPVPVEAIRSFVPEALDIDTWDGQAWISILPFRIGEIRLKHMPSLPWMRSFPEINVRTYVRSGGESAIFFLSMGASHPLLVPIAKQWYRLPYHLAKMRFRAGGRTITFESRRRSASFSEEAFCTTYRPVSAPFAVRQGTVEHWLMERYIYYCRCGRSGGLYRGEVVHAPWELQTAEADFSCRALTRGFGLELGTPALLHYSRGTRALIGLCRKAPK
ncbi:YqjF family protein [Paenibacillus elgii]